MGNSTHKQGTHDIHGKGDTQGIQGKEGKEDKGNEGDKGGHSQQGNKGKGDSGTHVEHPRAFKGEEGRLQGKEGRSQGKFGYLKGSDKENFGSLPSIYRNRSYVQLNRDIDRDK